jgi:hypothetical protein
MNSLEFKVLYRQVKERIPEKWYEATSHVVPITGIGIIGTGAASDLLMSGYYQQAALGAAVYLGGTIADKVTTYQALKAKETLNAIGGPHVIFDKNTQPHISANVRKFDTASNYILSIKKNALDSAGIPLTSVAPGIGLGIGILRTITAINTRRQTERAQLLHELYTSQTAD